MHLYFETWRSLIGDYKPFFKRSSENNLSEKNKKFDMMRFGKWSRMILAVRIKWRKWNTFSNRYIDIHIDRHPHRCKNICITTKILTFSSPVVHFFRLWQWVHQVGGVVFHFSVSEQKTLVITSPSPSQVSNYLFYERRINQGNIKTIWVLGDVIIVTYNFGQIQINRKWPTKKYWLVDMNV